MIFIIALSLGCIDSGTPSSQTQQIDSDNDGWTDEEEIIAGTDPYDSDTDGDGYIDPKDPNPLVSQSTAPPTALPPVTTPPPTTTPAPTNSPTTPPPTTTPAPTVTMPPPDFPDLGSITFAFENYHSSDSTCCRTGDIINKIANLGADTMLYEEPIVTVGNLSSSGIQVLVFGVDKEELSSSDLEELYVFVQQGGIIWLAAATPSYNELLDLFGTQIDFIRKTEIIETDFYCNDSDWISYDVEEFRISTIYTYENLENWNESIHVPGYGGYHEWPQVIYKKSGDGYIFSSNMSFYKSYNIKDNKIVFDNISYLIGSLV